MLRKPKVWFVLLAAYVLMQFSWWAVYLVQLRRDIRTLELSLAEDEGQREAIRAAYRSKLMMVAGEGLVFLLILFAGIWVVYRSLKREEHIHRLRSQFLLSVSHELKTPVAAMKLFLQSFGRRPQDSERLIPMAGHALAETDRLEMLVGKMLFSAGLESGTVHAPGVTVEVSELLETVKQRYDMHPQKQRLLFKSDAEARVVGDPEHLSFALMNLIDNALIYAPEGTVEVACECSESVVVISVRDHGPGIAQEEQERIFGKFYRTPGHTGTKGTGLGLYIVQSIARLYGGDVRVKHAIPGAKFELELKSAKLH